MMRLKWRSMVVSSLVVEYFATADVANYDLEILNNLLTKCFNKYMSILQWRFLIWPRMYCECFNPWSHRLYSHPKLCHPMFLFGYYISLPLVTSVEDCWNHCLFLNVFDVPLLQFKFINLYSNFAASYVW